VSLWTLALTKRTLHDMAVEVGVRELRENLSTWLDRAAAGEEIVVTERGRPKARLAPLVTAEDIIAQLAREGRVRPALPGPRQPLPPAIPVEGNPVTDALLAHRRAKDY
jgi:prevent-host-death family protein